jgi:HEAT repeat protein
MKRAKLRGLKRNAAVVLGNVGTRDDVEVLSRSLDDSEPLVREHADWALGRAGFAGASGALRERTVTKFHATVRAESGSPLGALLSTPRSGTGSSSTLL